MPLLGRRKPGEVFVPPPVPLRSEIERWSAEADRLLPLMEAEADHFGPFHRQWRIAMQQADRTSIGLIAIDNTDPKGWRCLGTRHFDKPRRPLEDYREG